MAVTQEMQNKIRLAEKHVLELPSYVQEFYADKKDDLAKTTLLQYLYQYKNFFNWLIEKKISKGPTIADVQLKELEFLKKDVLKKYFEELQHENIASENKQNHSVVETRHTKSINAMKCALRSLFNYLSSETENDEGECYIYRNIMLKFPLKRIKVSPAARAAEINQFLLKDHQVKGFLDFLQTDYEKIIEDNKHKLSSFIRDKERNFAIFSLFLGSGIRLAELASLEIKKIDFRNGSILIDRKGDKYEAVAITIDSVLAIEKYIKIRNERYPGAEYSPFLFVSSYGGIKNFSHRAIQKLVEKFTDAYLNSFQHSQTPHGITPHKLRHSFALQYYNSNQGNIKLLSEQLGHSDINTTSLYVNMADSLRQDAIERLSEDVNSK